MEKMICPTQIKHQLRLYHLNWRGKLSVQHKWKINWDCTTSIEGENYLFHANEKSTETGISSQMISGNESKKKMGKLSVYEESLKESDKV